MKNTFTHDQISTILSAADDSYGTKDIFLLLIHTGMRVGELLSMKTRDINIAERTMRIRETKTATERIIPIHRDILPIIEARMGGEYLVEIDGMPVSPATLSRNWARFMKPLGIEHSPHATRHTFIIDQLNL